MSDVDRQESEADAADCVSAEERSEGATRRQFLVQSAEVAALSLFGVVAFDALLEKVLSRAAEIDAFGGIASSALAHLEDSGVIGVAHAFGGCPPGSNYACNSNTTPKFLICGTSSYDYQCQWPNSFHCQLDATHFGCLAGYSCPPVIAGFHCHPGEAGGGFNCTYPTPFQCGGSAYGYLCPSASEFYMVCQYDPAAPYLCSQPQGQFDECQVTAGKECTTSSFTCQAKAGYHCQVADTAHHFNCGSSQAEFDCTTQTTYDFTCQNNDHFNCGSQGSASFTCDANHMFMCYQGSRFDCDGTSFTCNAGGNKCEEGSTGGYTFNEPGDFTCGLNTTPGGAGSTFECDPYSQQKKTGFSCSATDDFLCAGQGLFACPVPFAECAPHDPGGYFVCNEYSKDTNSGFNCQAQGEQQFSCVESMKYSTV